MCLLSDSANVSRESDLFLFSAQNGSVRYSRHCSISARTHHAYELLRDLRLELVDVETSRKQVSRLQRRYECRFVDDRSARGVDNSGSGLHCRKERRVDQVMRRLHVRHCKEQRKDESENRSPCDREEYAPETLTQSA